MKCVRHSKLCFKIKEILKFSELSSLKFSVNMSVLATLLEKKWKNNNKKQLPFAFIYEHVSTGIIKS